MATAGALMARIEEARHREGFDISWGYHSRVSVEHRYVCMTVPKVACTTVKLTLHEFEGLPRAADWGMVHDQDSPRLSSFSVSQAAEMLSSPDWLRSAFVRDPYDRIFSAWKQKIVNSWDTQYAGLRDQIRTANSYSSHTDRPAPAIAFRDFVRFVVESDDPGVIFDAHWDLQTRILLNDLIAYDAVGRFETFVEDFTAVLRRLDAPEHVISTARQVTNHTTRVPLSAAYDRELAELVYRKYEPDFAAFGYDRDGWMFGGAR
jgi:Sulfotransferase family